MKFLVGLILGVLILPVWALIYFHFGHPPVAVADAPFPMERQLVHAPLHARIDKEMPASAPMEASATNLTAGAQVYREQCASCHGLYGRPSAFGSHMYPKAPELWAPHGNGGVIGVNDDPVGETYWKVANGIRLSGMPSFDKVLNETQMWQVSLLLKNAGQPMPAEATKLLETPLDLSVPGGPAANPTPPASPSSQ
ncbi:MAG: cytochrome c [Acidobacteriaceae bacterium]|jgi:mono/diheme cytochrome c family protein